jgi:hypothetical protein
VQHHHIVGDFTSRDRSSTGAEGEAPVFVSTGSESEVQKTMYLKKWCLIVPPFGIGDWRPPGNVDSLSGRGLNQVAPSDVLPDSTAQDSSSFMYVS